MEETILSKENSKVLRGVAIVSIALHNYFVKLGFSKPNEMSFLIENTNHFFEVAIAGRFFAEIFSFLGWIGVPVFIFLTGYGVATRMPPLSKHKSIDYIRRNYLKLLALMLLAVLLYAGLDVAKGDIWPGLLKRFSYLTMLTNFAYPYLRCDPGVYWYFGLTFQFYLLWAFFGRHMKSKNLLLWSAIFMIGLYSLCFVGKPKVLSIYRHCFTGWFFVFALGIWCAQSNMIQRIKTSWWMELIIVVASAFLMIQMNRWLLAWIFIPVVALLFFLMLGLLLQRVKPLFNIFLWIGGLSAFIFVCHPIARTFVNKILAPHVGILLINVFIYLLFTILFAVLYRWLYQRITAVIIR